MFRSSSLTPTEMRQFRMRLLAWFDREQRKLPWRGEKDPYRILVSEIMLQQTRVAVVEERYKAFLRQFPVVEKLARARQQTVLAAWSGLGYYRRARALHEAAKQVTRLRAFPRTASDLMNLPGVGRYTAAAVASIAYAEPAAVVDGNVKRVLSRLSGRQLRDEDYWSVAEALLAPRRPGDFNQAMMELGAIICRSSEPHCARCPVVSFCATRGNIAEKTRAVRRKAVLEYLLARRNGSVLLKQRPRDASLMPGMWELPPYEGTANGSRPVLRLRHSITNTDYSVLVYEGAPSRDGTWFSLSGAQKMALTGLTKKILHALVERG